uniref:Uncharacterized protein n=1 Tax=Oryza sativa subsp. japonica TaxID=39947 RepID=Q10MM1_ORYSJ|nr:hypothetical protein LOC_Os03g19129 [Oryza sativa Japonica Group]
MAEYAGALQWAHIVDELAESVDRT